MSKTKDMRRVKTLNPISALIPFIMPNRTGSMVFIEDSISTDSIDSYIKQKRTEGMLDISFMHILIAAYVRTVSQRPAINRFIRGQRIWTRRSIDVSITIKKDMTLDGEETVVKFRFMPEDTLFDIYKKMNEEIKKYRESPGEDLDKTLKIMNYIPRPFLRFFIGLLNFLDYYNMFPKFLNEISPFHSSLYLTSMGSLGIPSVFHHLYDFGTCPAFIAFGKKNRMNLVNDNGSIFKNKTVDISITVDERICDGFYWASALKYLKSILKDPSVLESPPESVVEDIK